MDQDWINILGPIIVFVIYALAKLFGGKDDDEIVPPPDRETDGRPPARQNQPHPQQRQVEEDRRARDIREEIRRKMAERRAQQEGTAPSPAQQPPPRQQPAPAAPSTFEPEPVFVPPPARNLQAEIEEQQRRAQEAAQRLEEARKRREASEQRAARDVAAWAQKRGPVRASTDPRLEARRLLREGGVSAREAVIYMELLGTPLGLRDKGAIRPSWEV